MKSVAAALLDLLHLLRPRLLIVRAVARPGEITFTCKKIGVPEPLDSIVAADKRSSRTAYVFLRDAFDNLGWLFSRAKLDFGRLRKLRISLLTKAPSLNGGASSGIDI
jgi:hypothetical protein